MTVPQHVKQAKRLWAGGSLGLGLVFVLFNMGEYFVAAPPWLTFLFYGIFLFLIVTYISLGALILAARDTWYREGTGSPDSYLPEKNFTH
jgi:hypothetical protein